MWNKFTIGVLISNKMNKSNFEILFRYHGKIWKICIFFFFFSFNWKLTNFVLILYHEKPQLLTLLTKDSQIGFQMLFCHLYLLLPWQQDHKQQINSVLPFLLTEVYQNVKYKENWWLSSMRGPPVFILS